MKTLITLILATFSTSLLAQDIDSRPTDQCLANINEAMFKLGTSQNEDENEISFEMFLDKRGDRYTFMYYKLDASTQTLDITGKGAIDLTIKHSVPNYGLTDIDDCDVANPEILEEKHEAQPEEDN